MGQKVSPVGLRVGVIRDWESRWFAEKEYGTLLLEDIKVREFLEKELKNAALARVEIERSKNRVHVYIYTARPGVVIGNGGENAELLKSKIVKLTNGKTVNLSIVEIENPDCNAALVARQIADQLEARASFRTVQKKAIQRTMRAGAKGIKTLVSGRLGGADIARDEGYSEGIVPLHTLRADIDYAHAEAATTYGRLGVKVWICRGEVMPGEKVVDMPAPKQNDRRGNKNEKGKRVNRKPRPAKTENVETVEGGN